MSGAQSSQTDISVAVRVVEFLPASQKRLRCARNLIPGGSGAFVGDRRWGTTDNPDLQPVKCLACHEDPQMMKAAAGEPGMWL